MLPQVGVTNFVGQNIRVDFADHPTCYIANWNFSIQRQINSNLMAEVAYVGSKATHLFWNRMDNADDPLVLQQYGSHLLDVVPNPYFGVIQGGIGAFSTITRDQLLRPYPQYQQILAVRRPYGDSEYNSMTVRVEKRLQQGLHAVAGLYALEADRLHSRIQHLGGRAVQCALQRELQPRHRGQRYAAPAGDRASLGTALRSRQAVSCRKASRRAFSADGNSPESPCCRRDGRS